MTKEEILNLNLTNARKDAYSAWCVTMERLHKDTAVADITNKTTADAWIDALIARSAKSAAAKAKRVEKKAAKEEEVKRIYELLDYAKEAGKTTQDVINIVMSAIKAEYNKKVEDKIAEMQAKMEAEIAAMREKMM